MWRNDRELLKKREKKISQHILIIKIILMSMDSYYTEIDRSWRNVFEFV
jgi:hypothetical protein